MITFKNYLRGRLLTEGAAGGHMDHPFDLPGVNNGNDLLKVFTKAADSAHGRGMTEQEFSYVVKIDGVNASIRLDENMEFVLDRGSKTTNKIGGKLDFKGIAVDDLHARFVPKEGETEHGFWESGQITLDIFNTARVNSKDIQKPISKLQLDKWNGTYGRVINMEFVKSTTNVIEYANNFLAMHNIKKFINVVNEKTKRESRQIWDPVEHKDKSYPGTPVTFSYKDLNELADAIRPFAMDKGFDIQTIYPISLAQDINIDYGKALESPFGVRYTHDDIRSQSLGGWLSNAENTKDKRFKCLKQISHSLVPNILKEGEPYYCVNKLVYLTVLEQQYPLQDWVPQESWQDVVDGAIFYHATRELGNAFLTDLSSDLGSVKEHEGAVIKDQSIADGAEFKITGEFIVTGFTTSKFR